MKKFGCFFGLFAYLMGSIGSLGYVLYCKQYVIAIALAVVICMAYPTAKKWLKEILS